MGVCALKRDSKARSCTAMEYLTRTALASTGAQQMLAAPLLRWCGQEAWARNDTKLMAWVLEHAAARGLPLTNFAPAAASAKMTARTWRPSATTPTAPTFTSSAPSACKAACCPAAR